MCVVRWFLIGIDNGFLFQILGSAGVGGPSRRDAGGIINWVVDNASGVGYIHALCILPPLPCSSSVSRFSTSSILAIRYCLFFFSLSGYFLRLVSSAIELLHHIDAGYLEDPSIIRVSTPLQ